MPVVRTGRREENKRQKLLRIRQATRDVFLEKGYEAATIREIANAANVALGTLFLYAKNKRDLLLLLYDEEIEQLTKVAFDKADENLSFIDQLLAFFREFLAYFSQNPRLSADMLREVTFSSGGIVAARLWGVLREIELLIARVVARAQAKGHIRAGVAPEAAAHLIWSLYRIEVRFCIDAEQPDVERSLSRLRGQFEILIDGLGAAPFLAKPTHTDGVSRGSAKS